MEYWMQLDVWYYLVVTKNKYVTNACKQFRSSRLEQMVTAIYFISRNIESFSAKSTMVFILRNKPINTFQHVFFCLFNEFLIDI